MMRQNGLTKVMAFVLTLALVLQWGQVNTYAGYTTEETWHISETQIVNDDYEIVDGDELRNVDLIIIGAEDDKPFDDAIMYGAFSVGEYGVQTVNVAVNPKPDFQIVAHSEEDDPFEFKSIDLHTPEEASEIVIKGFYKDNEVASYTTTIEQGTSTVDLTEVEGFDYINEFRIYNVFDGTLVVVTFDNITVDYPSNAYDPKISDITVWNDESKFGIGDEVYIDVAFDKDVVVPEDSDFELYLSTNNGYSRAYFDEQIVGDVLGFTYTVEEGDESEDLDYAGTTPLEKIQGNIYGDDLYNTPADLTLPVPGEEGSLSAEYDIVIDGVRPVVTLTPDVSTIESLNPFDLTVSVSEVCNFGTDNYPIIYNGSVTGAEQINETTFQLEITPTEAGNVTITYPKDRITDQVDNGNIGLNNQSIQWISSDNTAPIITSDQFYTVNENADYSFYTATATDAEDNLLTWSLTGVDVNRFHFDTDSGVLAFVEAPDYENPKDENKDNVYELVLKVTDGELVSTMPLEIQVNNRYEYVITSSGDALRVEEGSTDAFYTATGYSVEGEELEWYMDGRDGDLFSIDASGALRFIEAPSLENPKDDNSDNVYEIGVGIGSAYLSLEVTVVEKQEEPTPTPTPEPEPSRPDRSRDDDEDEGTDLDKTIQEKATIADRVNQSQGQDVTKKVTTVNGDHITKATMAKAVDTIVKELETTQETSDKVTPVLNIALDESKSVELEKDNLDALVQHGVELSIQHGDTLLTVQPSELKGNDNETLEEIESLEISVEKLEDKEVTRVSNHYKEQGVTVVGDPYVFHMTATTKDGKQEVGGLGNYMTKTLPAYDDGTAIVVGFADGNNNIVEGQSAGHKELVENLKTTMVVAVPYKMLTLNQEDTVVSESYYQAQNKSFSTYYVLHNNVQFADMTNHWAKDAAVNMVNRYIMADYNTINFKATEGVTRREMARIIVSSIGLSFYNFEDSFEDVEGDDAYLMFMNAVVDEGFMSAKDGYFHPESIMTRGDMMELIAKIMAYTGHSEQLTEADIKDYASTYPVLVGMEEQYQKDIMLSIKAGIIQGRSQNDLALDAALTRAEAAVIYERLLKKIGFID